jgi:hypothetical protein
MDVSSTLAAKSNQLNAVDLPRPRIFRVLAVKVGGTTEQPIDVQIDGWPHPWKPCKSMRRVLAAAWGTESNEWLGKTVELYCDPDVLWAGERAGGIRISALSDIPAGGIEVVLRASSKKSAPVRFKRLDTTDPLLAVAAERGEDIAATEAAIAAASNRPCPTDHAGRVKAAAWARSEKGRAALAAATSTTADAPQHGD